MARNVFRGKDELRGILSGAIRIDSSVVEVSHIRELSSHQPFGRRFTLMYYISLLGGAWLMLLGGIWALQFQRQEEAAYWVGPIALVLGLVAYFSAVFRRLGASDRLLYAIEDSMLELNGMLRYLDSYIKKVRGSTQTRLHCLSEDAFTNLILLDSLRHAISEKINEVQKVYCNNRVKTLKSVAKVLTGKIVVKEYSVSCQHLTYEIPMAELRDLVEELLSNMDYGITQIEKSARTEYTASYDPFHNY